MSNINKQLDAFERKEKLKRFIPILAIILVFALGLFVVTQLKSEHGKEVQADIIDVMVALTETGNVAKLQIKTPEGLFYVTLPKGTKLHRSGKALVYEYTTSTGRTKYTFLRYIE